MNMKSVRTRFSNGVGLVGLAVGAVLLLGAAIYATSQTQAEAHWKTQHSIASGAHAASVRRANAADAADAAAQAAAQAETEAQAEQAKADQLALSKGFAKSPDDDSVYYKEAGGTCPAFTACANVSIVASRTCAQGVYVAANLLRGRTVVSKGNDITGALTSSASSALAQLRFPFAENITGTLVFDVTSARCLGS